MWNPCWSFCLLNGPRWFLIGISPEFNCSMWNPCSSFCILNGPRLDSMFHQPNPYPLVAWMLRTKRGEGPEWLGIGSVHQFIRKILWPDSQWCKAAWTVTHQPPPFDPKDYAKCKVARLLAPPGQDHSHQENPKFVVFQKYEWGTQAFSDAPTMISKEQKNRIPQRFGIQIQIQILHVCALFESGPHQSIVPYQYTISFFLKKTCFDVNAVQQH